MREDGAIEATFCFIDIAGYTALTDTHGEVAAQATGGRILCTQRVAEELETAGVPHVEVGHHGLVSLRNLPQPVDLYEIVLSSFVRDYAIDPVCKMQVDKQRAAGDLHFNKRTYWFCSLLCVERFAKDPLAYA